ncbi:serine hydrolase domain-containing protein [Nocardiopsis lambiniae]|uniref:Serine hydrolase domain-containing protein n=1 Tax=Nocardiopsis lambiniae TaxID=3075539 RepID=A0ABU2MAJ4_9ACTN|nr:serine hydrolase domain-containing protein [Nocardiopsis sp. DSM 44743]MDT0329702.1 serine hydrolase domain-containing protein [Nocardiopsis sp. DSM 44743]
MIPAKTTAPPRRRRTTVTLAASMGVLAVLATGCAAPAPQGTPAPPIPTPTAAELTQRDVDAWLDGLLPAALADTGIPGAVVSVVADGELLTARGYGYADTGSDGGGPVPVDAEDTLFRVGSVSKLFTATAVMRLVEEGRLDLDADVNEYLDFTLETEFDEPVTLRHLLTHTPGFEERIEGMFLPEDAVPDLRSYLVEDPPEQVYPPGTVPAYSNYGNSVAGYVVERVSGTPFDEYVDETVLEPLGMDSSTFAQPLPEDLRERLANGYMNDTSPAGSFEVIDDAPAGALTASAPDMARFMLAHLGEVDAETAPLTPETLDLMHSPALDADSLGALAEGQRMALGFFEEDRNGQRAIGHGGDTLYFHSHLSIHPDHGTGIFVSLNGGGREGIDSLRLREAVVNGFADRYLPGERPATAGTDTAVEHAAMAEGTYTASRTMHSTFLSVINVLGSTRVEARDDGTILVTPGPETMTPTVYEEIEPWVWREVGGQRLLAMRTDGDRVEAIGFASAFTLLRADPETSLAPPVLLSSVLVLLLAVLSWPIGAITRRLASRPARDRAGRTARVLTRIGVVGALTALIGWAVVVTALMGLRDVPEAVLRAIQGLQLLGVLAILPAAWVVVHDVRHRAGWKRYLGGALVLVALLGVQWFAVTFGLLAFDVSY